MYVYVLGQAKEYPAFLIHTQTKYSSKNLLKTEEKVASDVLEHFKCLVSPDLDLPDPSFVKCTTWTNCQVVFFMHYTLSHCHLK